MTMKSANAVYRPHLGIMLETMTIRRISCLLAGVLALLTRAHGQTGTSMSDPVFGIRYHTSKVRFDVASERVGQRCDGLRGRRLWVFASWKESDSEFLILSSRESNVSGIGVVIRDEICFQGLPDWVLTGDPRYWSGNGNRPAINFNERVLHGLATDLLKRYARAFGGKSSFIERVRADGLPVDQLLPTVRREFESFVATPM